MEITTEALSYWFFRLNGFLTIVDFVVHLERIGQTGTDVDILGVRFPYRAELFERPMTDYQEFTKITSRPYVAIAEVKRGLCNLNGPWITRERRIVEHVLRAIGVIPLEDLNTVADSLYLNGIFKCQNCYISLVCVGENRNTEIQKHFPMVPQILWTDITTFIYRRFREYRRVKSWHQHWDQNGQALWNLSCSCQDENEFIKSIEIQS